MKVIETWAMEQLMAERATAAERGLEAVKARQAKTEATLWKSLADTEAVLQVTLETLETERSALASERKAWSEADQEVLVLWGRVMGTEEANARLCAQVTRQAEEFSVLENFRVGTYLFCFSSCWFFLQPISELVVLLSELGGRVKMLERDLETIKATFSQNKEELAKSREEQRALEGDLDQIRNVA